MYVMVLVPVIVVNTLIVHYLWKSEFEFFNFIKQTDFLRIIISFIVGLIKFNRMLMMW